MIVISIIATLLAILLPSLQRARLQAKNVRCQSHLRQCALNYWSAAAESRYGFANWLDEVHKPGFWHAQGNPILCPFATKVLCETREEAQSRGPLGDQGGKFAAYGTRCEGNEPGWYGSYGSNHWTDYDVVLVGGGDKFYLRQRYWPYSKADGRPDIPLMMDARLGGMSPEPFDPPPAQDDAQATSWGMEVACIDRHQGSINTLFCDSSVRRVGLKELWTLKWHKTFNTAGKWTRAGGARAEDWPAWMRGFKEY